MICSETGYDDYESPEEFDAAFPEMTDAEIDAMFAASIETHVAVEPFCYCEVDSMCSPCRNSKDLAARLDRLDAQHWANFETVEPAVEPLRRAA